jgi:hypothetical protein
MILSTATTGARWAAYLGVALGVLYSVGGFFYDLFTTGLNAGTALAFLALIGMPLMFAAAGFAAGAVVGAVRAAASPSEDALGDADPTDTGRRAP